MDTKAKNGGFGIPRSWITQERNPRELRGIPGIDAINISGHLVSESRLLNHKKLRNLKKWLL